MAEKAFPAVVDTSPDEIVDQGGGFFHVCVIDLDVVDVLVGYRVGRTVDTPPPGSVG